ncbi:hypothetical protein K443DRAFT_655166, partial [Laccaria amethystina LaAM-08-1]
MIYVSHRESLPPPPASNLSFIKPFPEVKPCEIILRYRRPQLFPSAPFFLTYRILYAKALYPYQFSHYALLLPTAQSSTLSITHTSRRSPFGDFTSGMCLLRCSYAYNRPIKGSRTHLRTFRKLFLASWSPLSCQAIILSHTSNLPVLLRTVLGHCASPAFARTVTT